MKRAFYVGAALLALYELANVYLIMPMPYSQRWRSIDVAYSIYTWRWAFRGTAVVLMAAGLYGVGQSWSREKWAATICLLAVAGVTYVANFVLAADAMFRQPASVIMQPVSSNKVEPGRLIVGIVINGEARAYPVRFIGYHHQVRDAVGGTPVMVTYCTVCRTGRVFSPAIEGKTQVFRLVGMDHFNAMFEDASTRSWWRQATGEAIVGPRKGMSLTGLPSEQMTLAEWLALHPQSLIMQEDPEARSKYERGVDYENGTSRSMLTGSDPESWHDKSWVVGITLDGRSCAYDWNRLLRERVVNDEIGGQPIVLVIAPDSASFFAYRRPDGDTRFALVADRLVAADRSYTLGGRGETESLTPVFASQEFWHSWRSFHSDSDAR